MVVQPGVVGGDGQCLGEADRRSQAWREGAAAGWAEATTTPSSATSTAPASRWRTAIGRSSGGGVRSRTETAGASGVVWTRAAGWPLVQPPLPDSGGPQ